MLLGSGENDLELVCLYVTVTDKLTIGLGM
jgi:hypothetical protein